MGYGMPPGVVLLFVAMAAIFVAVVVWAIQAEKKRREALINFAAQNGWRFTQRDDRYARMWQGEPFRLFGGQAKEIFEGIWAPTGHHFIAFGYSYTETHTDAQGHRTSTTYHFEVRALGLPRALPRLSISSEGFWTKAGKLFGGQDIEFESDDFSRAFRVTADDARFAYGVIHPQFMEWMLGPGQTIVPWRIDNAYLVTFESGQLDINRFPHRLSLMADLARQIPEPVWTTYGR
ncbi:MAG: DUF3137 domain-containing protein [Propionibacteriaceae bacterium]|jgi:hypothetical protein|nr:DUF3137 domain-containing protein [Propionibacteriaceae bacterium]